MLFELSLMGLSMSAMVLFVIYDFDEKCFRWQKKDEI